MLTSRQPSHVKLVPETTGDTAPNRGAQNNSSSNAVSVESSTVRETRETVLDALVEQTTELVNEFVGQLYVHENGLGLRDRTNTSRSKVRLLAATTCGSQHDTEISTGIVACDASG